MVPVVILFIVFVAGGGSREKDALVSNDQAKILAILGPAGTGILDSYDDDGPLIDEDTEVSAATAFVKIFPIQK